MNKGGPHCPRLVTPIPAVKSRYFCPSAVYTSSPSPFTTTRSRIRPRPCETCSRPKSAHCSGVRMRAGMLEVIGYDFPESGEGGSRYGDPCPRHRNPGTTRDFCQTDHVRSHMTFPPKSKGQTPCRECRLSPRLTRDLPDQDVLSISADCTARPSLPQAGEIRKCLFSTRKDSL